MPDYAADPTIYSNNGPNSGSLIGGLANFATGGASGEAEDLRKRTASNLAALGATGQADYNEAGANADQSRGLQSDALTQLRLAALGQVPSAAELQMRKGIAANIAGGNALAASAPGVSATAALRGAQDAASTASDKGAVDTAALRATEQATARGQFATAAAQQRIEDEQRRQTAIQSILQSMGLANQTSGLATTAGNQNLQVTGALFKGLSSLLPSSGGAAAAPTAGG